MIEAQIELLYPGASQPAVAVKLQLPGRGVSALFGPSGAGKTSLLRCFAGLQACAGSLQVNGQTWLSESINVPTHRRELAYVFQEHSLLSHLTVQGNFEYAIKRARKPLSGGRAEVVLDGLRIRDLRARMPGTLSGGERQRVALARALLVQPQLLLLDEPLAALDDAHKRDVLDMLEALKPQVETPMLYVSHSLDDVTRLADHLVLLEQGRVIAEGPISDVLSRADLAHRLGEQAGVVIQGHIASRQPQWQLMQVVWDGGQLWVHDSGEPVGAEVRVRILARDVSLSLSAHEDTSILNRLQVQVVDININTAAATAVLRLCCGSNTLLARTTLRSLEHLNIRNQMSLWAQVKAVALVR